MSWGDFETMFQAVCKDINEEHRALSVISANMLANKLAVEGELDVFAAGSPAKNRLQAAIQADRSGYRSVAARWQRKMDAALAYAGTQLTTPSAHVRGDLPTNRRALLRDIRADMLAEDRDVASRKVTYDSEPTADDDGIIDRLTVDEHGIIIEGGVHTDIDVMVSSKPAEWRSVVTLSARTKGIDIFNLLGPVGTLNIEAVNDAFNGDGLVQNRLLTAGINSVVHGSAVTSLGGWTLGVAGGAPTHQVDTSILWRGGAFTHKIFGSGGQTRTFRQPLIVRSQHAQSPQNRFIAVFKTGSPTGNITIVQAGVTQTWTMASLSAGWNYLRLDRDSDLYPSQFDAQAAQQGFDVECTTGDASNYVNIACFLGQVYRKFNGAWWGHWSRNGQSVLSVPGTPAFTLQDSMTAAGKNQTALYLAYHNTPDRDYAYLRHVDDASETLADYS